MPAERSAGAVVFHRGDLGHRAEQIEYLLLLSSYWGFPKGHVEPGESERDAALREIREEAGLEVTLLDGFHEVDEYWYHRDGERIQKQAIFFLAEAPHRDSKISWEHKEMVWLSFAEAMARLTYENGRKILKKANAFLLKRET